MTGRKPNADAPPRLPADSLAWSLHAAAGVIGAVIGGRNLDAALAAQKLAATARPAVMDLAYGALRSFGRGDFFLACLIERPLGDATVRGLLLAALQRLEARPQDAHTTVDQAVTAAAVLARGKYKALVNGVLRNFLRRRDELVTAAAGDDVARWQHPAWWLAKLRSAYPADWQAIAAAGNEHPPMTLRVNARRTPAGIPSGHTTADFLAELARADIAGRVLDQAAIRLAKPVPIDRLPGFAEGRVSVQDYGAQQAASLLAAQPGMRVLDACAAPGGKTAHLLELADLDLTALDADPARAGRIDDNLRRLGLAATVKVADCRDLAAWWDGRPFERILADVPCSASGVARRHPDMKWLRRPEDIAGFAATQAEILAALWRTLAPGGTMLYATCSLFAEENAGQVAAFVARHPDAQRLPTHGEEYEWQLTPDADQDGFFYARIAKR
ncbi:MAG: 16S rRNA (cytosine(967)-C(5))-methyltransferase RsmB [Rhodocyclales bacterium]|nr:16S rRNA (cytosine(967)-C(5))-methyltransferase RsmB [Rhodocyclales bacterium]